jgi:hypothetical protein
MAVKMIDNKHFTCLSTDTKPTTATSSEVELLDIITETDTGNDFITYDGLNWVAYEKDERVVKKVTTIASPITLSAAAQYVYQKVSVGTPFYYGGTFLSWNTGAWAGGESVTVTLDLKIDGVNWENFWTETYTAANAPLSLAIPNIVDANLRKHPQGFWNDGSGIRVGLIQTVTGAGFHVVSHFTLEQS